jgi:hypothetical protein
MSHPNGRGGEILPSQPTWSDVPPGSIIQKLRTLFVAMSGSSTDWYTPVVLNRARPMLPLNLPPAAVGVVVAAGATVQQEAVS